MYCTAKITNTGFYSQRLSHYQTKSSQTRQRLTQSPVLRPLCRLSLVILLVPH
uniref:Uncharacterized protein n=1 Tax=Ciona intestinalis TaxID=7719 RepID=H2XPB9_CIOIN